MLHIGRTTIRETIAVCPLGFAVGILASNASSNEKRTCVEVFEGPLRNALTNNGGTNWPSVIDTGILFGVACDAEDLDSYFKAGGWTVGKHRGRPPGASTGPFGPPNRRFHYDFIYGYVHCTWSFRSITLGK